MGCGIRPRPLAEDSVSDFADFVLFAAYRTPAMVAQPDNDPRSQPRSVGTARRLLARLRDVMAGSGPVQARLDRIVRLVAAEMVAEVCSIYVMRPGDVLELFSTVGLRSEAVHRTRLSVGEGLVGE